MYRILTLCLFCAVMGYAGTNISGTRKKNITLAKFNVGVDSDIKNIQEWIDMNPEIDIIEVAFSGEKLFVLYR